MDPLPGFPEVADFFLTLGLLGKSGQEQEKARAVMEDCRDFLERRGVTNPLRQHFAGYLETVSRPDEALAILREAYNFARSKWPALESPVAALERRREARKPAVLHPRLGELLRRAGVGAKRKEEPRAACRRNWSDEDRRWERRTGEGTGTLGVGDMARELAGARGDDREAGFRAALQGQGLRLGEALAITNSSLAGQDEKPGEGTSSAGAARELAKHKHLGHLARGEQSGQGTGDPWYCAACTVAGDVRHPRCAAEGCACLCRAGSDGGAG